MAIKGTSGGLRGPAAVEGCGIGIRSEESFVG